jgi:hypothetical protein
MLMEICCYWEIQSLTNCLEGGLLPKGVHGEPEMHRGEEYVQDQDWPKQVAVEPKREPEQEHIEGEPIGK